ncbi:hypothetical protein [Pseudomonas sp. EggHat1]|uniref:hypothetical protein n=1 Tax=Pseudomonas sp. EggHat1 TaxID=2761624 RepID=UPI0018687F06|nr:hypothetical protein [Pseudomonas sp. EggHat1]
MNKIAIDPIEVQFGLVHDCIRACVYADHIHQVPNKKDAWLSIMDMCYSDAIMSWNTIFGTNSQETHWKKLAAALPVPKQSQLKPFDKAMIIDYLNISDGEWNEYYKRMVDFRNHRLAHFQHTIIEQEPPNITWALHSAYLYREWLLSLLRAHQAAGVKMKITKTSGADMLALFKKQIEELCK